MSYEYNELKIEGKTKFSPSGFSTFYANPSVWYDKNIAKISEFRGNTNTGSLRSLKGTLCIVIQ